jgi:anti-sigma B factor antagonist
MVSTIEGGGARSESPARLGIECIGDGARCNLLLSGEIDLATAPQLEGAVRQLCADGARALTLDMGALMFIDSRGLRAILEAQKLCATYEAAFFLTPGPPQIQRLFEVTGLLSALPFRESGDEPGDGQPDHAG